VWYNKGTETTHRKNEEKENAEMRLTKKNMKAAVLTRQINTDPNIKARGEARARTWAREMGANENKIAKEYLLGKKVLAKYTLTFSRRFQRGTARPSIPANIAGHIQVDSGHIATSEAVRFAMFRKR
jgi:hypothetical protein